MRKNILLCGAILACLSQPVVWAAGAGTMSLHMHLSTQPHINVAVSLDLPVVSAFYIEGSNTVPVARG